MPAPSYASPFSWPVAAASVPRRASASALSLRLDSSHEFRRLLPQAIVRHAPASRHVVVREPPGRLAHFFREALVPVRARVRRGEQFFHDGPALALERRERARHVLARLAEGPVERDRVLEREARSGTDREMHGAQRVADQDKLPRGPAPVRQQRKLPPQRPVRDQRMPVEIRCEYPLAVRARLGVIHPAESRPVPGELIAFDDKGAHRPSVAVMVSDKRTVLVAAEGEREAVERLRGAVPREAVGEQLDPRLKQLLQCPSHQRIRSVSPDDDVGAIELLERRHGAAIPDFHAGVTAQFSQDFLERKTPDGGKAVAVDVDALVAVHDALHRPALHRRLHDIRELRLIALEKRQRAVGEHHPESVGRPFGILLGDLDPPGRIAALGEQREQEAGRPGPDYCDAHFMTASYFTVEPPVLPATASQFTNDPPGAGIAAIWSL